jgi:TonB family protein
VKDYRLRRAAGQGGTWFLSLSLMVAAAAGVRAQSATDAEAAMRRVGRARALAASHNLSAAAAELDAIISATTDDAIRDVARVMLMNVYLEEANYTKADALLVATFEGRSAERESSIRSYFALAGQTINGARAHLERYRSFGINVADSGLPPEAVNDLDRMRLLLERVVEQAKEITSQDPKRSDAAALLEEAAGVRSTLARNEQERQQWQREIAGARESLAATETRIASLGRASNASSASNSAPGSGSAANRVAPAGVAAAPPPPPSANTTAARTPGAVPETRPAAPGQNDAHGNTPGTNSAQPSTPVNVGSLLDKATQKISPNYPAVARNAHVTGVVTVFLEIDEKGAVANVYRTDGPQLLRQAAVDAARRWKFKPPVVGDQPVRMMGFINFSFTQ